MDKIRYKCTSCGYKFSRARDVEFSKICQFCGKTTLVKDSQDEAAKLLSEASSARYE